MSSNPYEFHLHPESGQPCIVFAYQVFRNAELLGAVIGQCASQALLLAEEDFGPGDTWTIVAVDEELAEQPTQVVLSDAVVTMPFREVAIAMGESNAYFPLWVFREEQVQENEAGD